MRPSRLLLAVIIVAVSAIAGAAVAWRVRGDLRCGLALAGVVRTGMPRMVERDGLRWFPADAESAAAIVRAVGAFADDVRYLPAASVDPIPADPAGTMVVLICRERGWRDRLCFLTNASSVHMAHADAFPPDWATLPALRR